jgi:hypothetical protein
MSKETEDKEASEIDKAFTELRMAFSKVTKVLEGKLGHNPSRMAEMLFSIINTLATGALMEVAAVRQANKKTEAKE